MTRMLIVCPDVAAVRRVMARNPKSRAISAAAVHREYGAPAKRIVVMPGVDVTDELLEILARRQTCYVDRELVVL